MTSNLTTMKNLNFALLFLSIILINCTGNSSRKSMKTPATVIEHTIHNEDIYDAPIKTQITLEVIVNPENLNELKIRDLLNYLYDKTKKRTGFQYHKNPTNIFIYVFTSKEKAESGMGQWIGMISKSYDETTPKISVSETQLNSLNEVEEEKWGLTHNQRLEVWDKIIRLEDKAQLEADKKYPLDKAGITMDDINKNSDLMKKLKSQYEIELAKEYSISKNIIDSVGLEGLKNGWAFPK